MEFVPNRSGLTAAINPAIAGQTSVLVFYVGGRKTLALTSKSTLNVSSTSQVFGGGDQATVVADNSEIDITSFNGVQMVVGLTSNFNSPTNNVSILSPVCQTLDTTGFEHRTIAVCSSTANTWVYYLVTDETDTKKTRIKEYDLVNATSQVIKDEQLADIGVNCSLSAYYDKKTDSRYVFYQSNEKTGLMVEYCVNKGTRLPINATKSNLQKDTSTAVTTSDGKVFLYAVRRDTDKLVRFTKVDGVWETGPKDQEQTDSVDERSMLTAVTGVDSGNQKMNYIFYFAPGKPSIQTHSDSLTS